jgi:hypothetical protein
MTEASLGPTHPEVAKALDNLGMVYTHQRRFEEAEAFFKRAQTILGSRVWVQQYRCCDKPEPVGLALQSAGEVEGGRTTSLEKSALMHQKWRVP